MTCDRTLWYAIPLATAQAAQRAFPKGNLYMTMRDVIGPIFTNPDFGGFCFNYWEERASADLGAGQRDRGGRGRADVS